LDFLSEDDTFMMTNEIILESIDIIEKKEKSEEKVM
jgi:hypothetical protein